VTGLKTAKNLPCATCGAAAVLGAGESYLVVETTTVNKTAESNHFDGLGAFLSLNDGALCGGMATEDKMCMPMAVDDAGNVSVFSLGSQSMFLTMSIGPNSPGGEEVDFYYPVRAGAKAVMFYFFADGAIGTDVSGLNP
jgi:hypothetical protein